MDSPANNVEDKVEPDFNGELVSGAKQSPLNDGLGCLSEREPEHLGQQSFPSLPEHESEIALEEVEDFVSLEPTQTASITHDQPLSSTASVGHRILSEDNPTSSPGDAVAIGADQEAAYSFTPPSAPRAKRTYVRKQYDHTNLRRSVRVPAIKEIQGLLNPTLPKVPPLKQNQSATGSRQRGRPKNVVKASSLSSTTKDQFEMETILDSCIEADTYVHYYLVKWKGYGDTKCTWEEKRVLMEDAPDAIREYHAQHGYKRQ